MIEVRNLSKSFNGRPVLQDVCLDIEDNKTLVILGPSGQGKTVLIKILAKLIEPDSGAVSYDGVDIIRISKKRFKEIQKKMAFVFQANALFDFLDVQDNLSLYLTMHTMLSVQEIEEKVMESIRFVGLDSTVLGKFPEELSGGMGKRVAIARAMVLRPEIIFYDEPTAGLDEGNVGKVVELISLLKTQVCATTVIVTHDVDLMFKVSDAVILLKEGRVVYSGKKEQVTEAMLRDLYATGENNGVQK
jgi:phospholipid/cholesterol/gamma-HCH transport system ATP-binding protein